uniref:Aa_trans domain-containing protein n=1 Tax=Caenorhabditis tropicalis TaxID=1561998 RepID=A0A1I7TY78_9PELO
MKRVDDELNGTRRAPTHLTIAFFAVSLFFTIVYQLLFDQIPPSEIIGTMSPAASLLIFIIPVYWMKPMRNLYMHYTTLE